MNREALWAMVHRVAKSQTRLKQLSVCITGNSVPVLWHNLNERRI